MSDNTKKVFVTLFISIIIICFILVFIINMNRNSIKPQNNIVTAQEYSYLLKEHNGKIGVFKYDEESPYLLLDIYIANLPEFDQKSLNKGIEVKDEVELEKYIEDFDS